MILGGLFVTNPKSIGTVLNTYNIEYNIVDISETTKPGVYIVSYWNEEGLGAHNVALLSSGDYYRSYNKKNSGTDPRVYAGDRAIIVYFLGPEVTN